MGVTGKMEGVARGGCGGGGRELAQKYEINQEVNTTL